MSYQEIGGSPKEQYEWETFKAQREFLVPWEEREEFARTVIGTAAVPAQSNGLTYPGRDKTVAVRLKMEPLDPGAIGIGPLEDLQTELPRYEGSFLKATVYYETVEEESRSDLPDVPAGSWITYRMTIGSIEETLGLSDWKWGDDPALPVAADLTGIKRIPITEHILTWKQVVSPPWSAISRMQGKLNAATFIGCDPGTLLFDGAEGYKLYYHGDSVDDTPSPYTWEIRYVFREKAIKSDGRVFGWNHFFREQPSGWVPLLKDGEPMYDSGNFNELFEPEA